MKIVNRSTKADRKGRIVVKIYRVSDSGRATNFPDSLNRKEEIVLDDTTVGEIFDIVEHAVSLADE
jgi:hypothetical protein